MDLSTDIAARLRDAFEALEHRGLSQAELARKVGVTRSTVGDWFHGRASKIYPENLFPLADALGVEARWLATGEGQRESVASSLFADISALPPQARAALQELLSALSDGRMPVERFAALVWALVGDPLKP